MIRISRVTGAEQSPTDAHLPHVLLVVDQLPKILGGGERIVLRMASLLPKYGYRVSILTFYCDPQCEMVATALCPVYVLPLKRTYNLQAMKSSFEFARFIADQDVNIVQTFFESSDIWAGVVTKMFSNAALIWSRRDMGILRGPKHRAMYRLLSRLPDAVLAVSELVRNHCIESDRVSAARVHVIYNGLDLSENGAAKELFENRCLPRIVSVGNIRKVKGHDVLIRAARIVLNQCPQVLFSIAGQVLEPEYFCELKALAAELNIEKNISFEGYVTDTRAYCRGADIFVLPSRSEGFSNAIVEAMAESLPVVATNVGGNAEAVKDGETGYIVPVDEPEALAASLLLLLTDPTGATAMGAAGRVRAATLFTSDAMMKKMVAIYRQVSLSTNR